MCYQQSRCLGRGAACPSRDVKSKERVDKELKPPTSLKEAKRVYGFYAWFRKFIPSFSSISSPLVRLSNSDSFYWDAELDEAFNSLRNTLLSNRVLAYPSRDGTRFMLYTDF